MPIQFAGSSSTGDRRRRRLAVNGDGVNLDTSSLPDEGVEMESQLVASSAARPWVPVSELRIWIYAGIIGVFLSGLTFALARPVPFRPALNPFVDLLLAGERPRLVVLVETLFLVFSTQLGLLITWYRSQCKLDFSGRYRVWPWAAGLFSLATILVSTNLHRVIGDVLGKADFFFWRGETVSWLLPLCVLALPITLLLDRDLRQSRSSLYTLRVSGSLWYLAAWVELFQPELSQRVNIEVIRHVLPMFASATLFLGLWLHSRIVAYVCPDPPELSEPSAISVLLRAASWCGRRLKFWNRTALAEAETEEESDADEELEKPRRRRKKAEPEEAAQKRKRKAPTKRAAPKTRAKTKPPEYDEADGLEDQVDEVTDETYEETDSENASYEETSTEDAWASTEAESSEEWNEEEVETSAAEPEYPVQSSKFVEAHKSHGSKVSAPHFQPQPSSRREEEAAEAVEQEAYASQESNEEMDEDAQLQRDSGMTADQMKGLSKRQKRELKKQNRDKQRGRG